MSCVLKRISAGISVTLGEVPNNVTSVNLTSGTIVNSVWIARGGASRSTLAGENITDYVIATVIPSMDGSLAVDTFLLNSVDDSGTPLPMQFALEMVFDDATTAVYPIKVSNAPDPGTTDEFEIISNQAINLNGEFNSFEFLMGVGPVIELDDDQWDGYN